MEKCTKPVFRNCVFIWAVRISVQLWCHCQKQQLSWCRHTTDGACSCLWPIGADWAYQKADLKETGTQIEGEYRNGQYEKKKSILWTLEETQNKSMNLKISRMWDAVFKYHLMLCFCFSHCVCCIDGPMNDEYVLLDLCFTPQCFSPHRGQASVCRQSGERSRQPNLLAKETGLQSPGKKALH